MATKVIAVGEVTSKREKFCYALGDVGCNFIWSFAASFLTLYYTDSVGLSAAFVGTMMFVARLLDGLSDIGMGVIIEKTNTRWGKARPWLLFACAPFALSLVLMMNVPSAMSAQNKSIYAFLTYVFMAVICYTAVNLAYHAMLARITKSAQDRSVISVVRMFMVLVVVLVLNSITPRLLEVFGGTRTQQAWSTVAAIYAGLAFVLLLVCFFGTKEKIESKETGEKAEKIPLLTSLKGIATNRYFYITAIMFICSYLSQGTNGIGIYYARDVLGNANLFGLVSLAQMAPMLIGMPLIPTLFKKFGKMNVIRCGILISTTATLIMLTSPTNLVVYMSGSVLRGAGGVPFSVAMFTLAADIVDFGEWKSGIRAEGFAYSSTSFGMKVGTGLGSALLGWMLAWGGYDASLTTQPESARTAMILLALVIPLILGVVQFVLVILWDMDKKYPNLQKELAERKAART